MLQDFQTMKYKKPLLVTALVAGILIVIAVAASLAISPVVERKAEQLLNRYATRARGIEHFTFSRVEFSPLSRSLTLHDVLVVYRSPKGLRKSIDRLEISVPIRAAACAVPALRPYAMPEKGSMDICNAITADGVSFSMPGLLAGSLEHAAISGIAADAGHIRALLDGRRPDPIDMLERTQLDGLDALRLRTTVQTGNGSAACNLEAFRLRGLHNLGIDEMRLERLKASTNKESAELALFGMDGFHAPDAATLRLLLSVRLTGQKTEQEITGSIEYILPMIQQWLTASVPPVRVLAIEKGTFRGARPQDVMSLDLIRLDWLSNSPREMKTAVRDLVLPAQLIEFNGLHLPGLKALRFSGESDARDENGRIRETGYLSLAQFGQLRYNASYTVPGGVFNFSPDQLLSMSLYDAAFTFVDQGALAYLALNQYDPDMAGPYFNQALDYGLPGTGNTALRAALKSFVDRPGTLDIVKTTNEATPLQRCVDTDTLGRLWRVTATPGKESLYDQMRRLAPAQ